MTRLCGGSQRGWDQTHVSLRAKKVSGEVPLHWEGKRWVSWWHLARWQHLGRGQAPEGCWVMHLGWRDLRQGLQTWERGSRMIRFKRTARNVTAGFSEETTMACESPQDICRPLREGGAPIMTKIQYLDTQGQIQIDVNAIFIVRLGFQPEVQPDFISTLKILMSYKH